VPPLFTIGYAHGTQGALLAALSAARVEVLADVRALASSRRPGFAKSSLRAAVEEAGIAYRHFKHLGTPKEGRDAARRGDYGALRRVYTGQLEHPEALAQMAELRALALDRRICLLCYCEERAKCHRGLLIEALLADFAVQDLAASVA
jgi:uncharacterized protein (DUF488 family)